MEVLRGCSFIIIGENNQERINQLHQLQLLAMQQVLATLTVSVLGKDKERKNDDGASDMGMQIGINEFDDTLDSELYMEWESSIERFFEYRETPDEKKFKIAKLKLTKHALIWLEELQAQRRRFVAADFKQI